MKILPAGLFILTVLLSCNSNKENDTAAEKPVSKDLHQIIITEENSTHTIDIKNFSLIGDSSETQIADAKEILKVKRKWPMAMQQKSRVLFEEILSKDFSMRGEGEFFGNREDYIKDREKGTWSIDTVRYENLVLQFFGEIAILTYRNKLKGTDIAGIPNKEFYTWADMFKKENGAWKILASHCIDARVEYFGK
jgi:hypothetical protein